MAKNADLIRRWFEEVWNKRRREVITEMMPPEVVIHDGGDTLVRVRGSQREMACSFLPIVHHLRERAMCLPSPCKRRRGVNGGSVQRVRELDLPVGRDVHQPRFLARRECGRIQQPHVGSSGCGGAQQCLAAFCRERVDTGTHERKHPGRHGQRRDAGALSQ